MHTNLEQTDARIAERLRELAQRDAQPGGEAVTREQAGGPSAQALVAGLATGGPVKGRAPYTWEEFRRRAALRTGTRVLRTPVFRHLAMLAAVLLVGVIGLVVAGRLRLAPSTQVARTQHATSAESGGRAADSSEALAPAADTSPGRQALEADRPVAAADAPPAQTNVLPMINTEAAERWLASGPAEPVIVRFGTRLAVFRLEDRIAQMDDLLTVANQENKAPDSICALRRERDRLVRSLAQVRYAETLVAEAP